MQGRPELRPRAAARRPACREPHGAGCPAFPEHRLPVLLPPPPPPPWGGNGRVMQWGPQPPPAGSAFPSVQRALPPVPGEGGQGPLRQYWHPHPVRKCDAVSESPGPTLSLCRGSGDLVAGRNGPSLGLPSPALPSRTPAMWPDESMSTGLSALLEAEDTGVPLLLPLPSTVMTVGLPDGPQRRGSQSWVCPYHVGGRGPL